METKIQQIVVMDSKVCGLGEDNRVYRWDYTKGEWVPNWHIAPTDTQAAEPM